MVRRLLLLVLGLAGCTAAPEPPADLILRGYAVVDPLARSVKVRDVYVVEGRVSYKAPSPPRPLRMMEGKGQWLVPGLCDARVASWGNASVQHYEKLYQEMGPDTLLKAALACGVTRVGIGYGAWKLEEALKRLELMGRPCAEGIKLGRILRAVPQEDPSTRMVVTRTADVDAVLSRDHDKVPYLLISYGSLGLPYWPPVSKDVMAASVAWAVSRGAKAWVQADTWTAMQEAVDAGAAVVQGLPEGEPPAALLRSLKRRGAYVAPMLSWLDLPELQGEVAAFDGELGRTLILPSVRASFKDLNLYQDRLRPQLEASPASRKARLLGVRRLAEAGVKLLLATEAGWMVGVFQGLSVRKGLARLAEAGLDPWARLDAATRWPAAFFGKEAPLQEGAPADLLALDADPLSDPQAYGRIAQVWRAGRPVDRSSLAPDLSRRHYPGRL